MLPTDGPFKVMQKYSAYFWGCKLWVGYHASVHKANQSEIIWAFCLNLKFVIYGFEFPDDKLVSQ